jgi:hypothetical protein
MRGPFMPTPKIQILEHLLEHLESVRGYWSTLPLVFGSTNDNGDGWAKPLLIAVLGVGIPAGIGGGISGTIVAYTNRDDVQDLKTSVSRLRQQVQELQQDIARAEGRRQAERDH